MTEKQAVEIIMKTVAEALADKDREICFLKDELQRVEKKLTAAEDAATDAVAREAAALACGKLCKKRIETREEK